MAVNQKEYITKKQQAFVDAYLSDPKMTGIQAAIKAGYSKKGANSISTQLLNNPKIKVLIDREMQERAKRTNIDKDYVLFALADALEMARGNKPIKVSRPKEDGGSEVVEVIRTDLTAMTRSAELLGKHLGMFVEKQDISVKHSLEKTVADISARNAEQRKSLLPKDNIEFDNGED